MNTNSISLTLLCLVAAAVPQFAAAPVPQQNLPVSLEQAYKTAALQISADRGSFTAANPGQNFSVSFSPKQVTVRTREGVLGLRLDGYGRGATLHPAAKPVLAANGNRLELRRSSVTEWYVNEDSGLEHGFTFGQRPSGDGPLAVAITAEGDFHPLSENRQTLVLSRAGQPVLRYSGLRAWDQTGRDLAATLSVTGRRILIEVDDAGAVYPVTIDPTLEQARLTSTQRVANGYFGASVAVNGDTALVGAWGENSARGAAYVFVRRGGNWIQQARLALPGGAPNDGFGYAVALSGQTALIGAQGENGYRGAAYVYAASGNIWIQQARLTASDATEKAFFGSSLALEGKTAVVTAHGDAAYRGAAYIFTASDNTWTQQAKLTAADGLAGDWFGSSAALSGNTAVVGAFEVEGWKGAAYVFTRSNSTWTQQAKLTAADGRPFDQFGTAVAVSGNTAVVGATCANSCSGAAYVFTRSGGLWTEQTRLIASGATNFGASVALVGDTALVGGPCGDTCNGAAYLFARQDSMWTQQTKYMAANPQFDADYGSAVALGGSTALIGAWGEDTFGGAAYPETAPLPCAVSLSLSYHLGVLNGDYTISSSVNASWVGKLVAGGSQSNLWQGPVSAIDFPKTGTFSFRLPPSGVVTVYSRLATASGAVCSDSQSIDTGR